MLPENVSHLRSHIGYWMRLVSNQVSQAFARRLESQGVTVAEWVILREMYASDKVTSPSAIAELTTLTRGAVSKLMDRLLEKNLIVRREASADRRFQEIQLTRSALALIPRLANLADENDDAFFSALTASERKTLTAILKKIAASQNLKTPPLK